jgi:hypothetical protein
MRTNRLSIPPHISRLPRLAVGLLAAATLSGPFCALAAAQDIPILRRLLEQLLVAELSAHDSEENAWYDENSKDREKVVQFNFFGREIDKRVASWTERSKSWLWMEEPSQTLTLELRQFEVRDARLVFAVDARAKMGFRVWGRIPRLVRGNASGTVWAKFTIEGSAAVGGGGLTDAQITKLKGKLRDMQFNNDLASPFERLVVDALNDHVRKKNKQLRHSAEKAIDRVKF